MGICESKAKNNFANIGAEAGLNTHENKIYRKPELFTGNPTIPIEMINEVLGSICKITIKKKEQYINGTGFFMKINNSLKYLITNYHIISEKELNEDIEIEIHNHKKMKLLLKDRDIKYFPSPKDITTIKIRNDDEIYSDITFLDYDMNYKKGYQIYKNIFVFSIEHPLGQRAACASGKIIGINNYEFHHNISTKDGSSGCPIILLNDNTNLIQVIGIHKGADYSKLLNCGTFIGEIFDNNKYLNNNLNNNNYLKINNNNYLNDNLNNKNNYLNNNLNNNNNYLNYNMNNNNNYNIVNTKDKFKLKRCDRRSGNSLFCGISN